MPTNDPSNDGSGPTVIDASATSNVEFGTAVLAAVAEEDGTDPESLPPLRDSVDPDLLNELRNANGASTNALTFEYHGYEVVVSSDGIIQLRSLA